MLELERAKVVDEWGGKYDVIILPEAHCSGDRIDCLNNHYIKTGLKAYASSPLRPPGIT